MKLALLVSFVSLSCFAASAFADSPNNNANQVSSVDQKAIVATKIKLAAIYTAAKSYQTEYKHFPRDSAELVKAGLDNLKDGWGRDIRYSGDESHFLAKSQGADGKDGGLFAAADLSMDESKMLTWDPMGKRSVAAAQGASPPCGDIDNPLGSAECPAPKAEPGKPQELKNEDWVIKPRTAQTTSFTLREPHSVLIVIKGVKDTNKGFKVQMKPDEGGSGAVSGGTVTRTLTLPAGRHTLSVTNSENALKRMTVHVSIILDPAK